LGISCIAAAAGAAGHEVMGLDLMFSEDAVADVRKAIRRFDPECVGVSVRNIDNQDMRHSIFFPAEVRDNVEVIESETDAPIVLGGAGFTIFPLECLEYFGLELGVVGEGEVAFPRLLEHLAEGLDPAELPGIAVRRGSDARVNLPVLSPDFNALEPPDREAFDVTPYNWVPGAPGTPFVANAQARRGCHMKCIYCANPLIEGRAIRVRDPVSVADELLLLEENHGVRFVCFTDALFNQPIEYSAVLCREIESRNLSTRWTCSLAPVDVDAWMLELMRRAGCVFLSVGNESGSNDMLTALRKGFSREDILRTVREARNLGFTIQCFLLLGGPGETRHTVEESVDFLEEIDPQGVTVTVGVRIYPGCELHDIAVREGVVKPGQNLLDPAFYISREVEPWLYEYMRGVCDGRPGWVM
jgi:radical SAM superfamily enzyme YgiQ (UPF0313 family)